MPVAMSSTDIATFSAAFSRAEKTLKRFERIGGKTLETAINQLRYAARDLDMDFIENFTRLFSPSAGKVHVAGKYVAMPIHHCANEFGECCTLSAFTSKKNVRDRKEAVLKYDFSQIR